ncbi:MAG: hypothetical protein JKY02_08800 [Flavobacteriaceae bacterium]|nr:hypothetical protein [Flavobacteriaceae bacterium]
MGIKNYTTNESSFSNKVVAWYVWFQKTKDFNFFQKIIVAILIAVPIVTLLAAFYLLIAQGLKINKMKLLQIMPPQETSTFMMDVEYILILSGIIIVVIFVVEKVRRRWLSR